MKYWYKYFIGECPVCGRNKSYKIRVVDQPRPKNKEDRYVFLSQMETYDYCIN